MLARILSRKQKWQDAVSTAKIQSPLTSSYLRKSTEQHRIHAKAETPRVLNDLIATKLKVIQPFSGF